MSEKCFQCGGRCNVDMQNVIGLTDVEEIVIEFNNKYFPDWKELNPIYYSNALAGGVGEVCNLTKKLSGGGTKQNKVHSLDILEELADVQIYILLLLGSLDMTFKQLQRQVLTKNKINIRRMEKSINRVGV